MATAVFRKAFCPKYETLIFAFHYVEQKGAIERSSLGSGPINLIGMADGIFVKSEEKPVGRAGIPDKGFDAGVCKYTVCPMD